HPDWSLPAQRRHDVAQPDEGVRGSSAREADPACLTPSTSEARPPRQEHRTPPIGRNLTVTTPTVPPAVAEFLVAQAAARHASPTRAALAKADSVVAAAERVPGVSVTHVQVYQPHDDPTYATLNLHVEPEALTQPVAVE